MNISKKNIQNIIRLSKQQENLMFEIETKNSTIYHCQSSYRISGYFNPQFCRLVWQKIIENHSQLRTVIKKTVENRYFQVILKEYTNFFTQYSIKDINNEENEIKEIMFREREKIKRLDDMLFHVALISSPNDINFMILTHHHILYDGWSLGILLEDFLYGYTSYLNNKEPLYSCFPTYKEAIDLQLRQEPKFNNDFWKQYLNSYTGQTELSLLSGGKKKEGFDYVTASLSIELSDKIKRYCRGREITPASFFYFAWILLLQRYLNQNDVCFLTASSGRNNIKDFDKTVGVFIQLLPVRFQAAQNNTIKDELKRFNNQYLQWLENQNDSLSQIISSVKDKQVRLPKDIIFIYENYPFTEIYKNINLPFKIELETSYETNNANLSVNVLDDGCYKMFFYYDLSVIEKMFIEKLLYRLKCIFKTITSQDNLLVADIDILTTYENEKLITETNCFNLFSHKNTIMHKIQEMEVLYPDKLALKYDAIQINYKELAAKVDAMSNILVEYGMHRNDIVAISTERSPEMIISILAVLKLGGCYLPIAPDCPLERFEYILNDSMAQYLIVKKKRIDLCGAIQDRIIQLEVNYNSLIAPDNSSLSIFCKPQDPAYIIYTSGSTGYPKGVIINHDAIINVLNWYNNMFNVTTEDVFLQKTNFNFDVSVIEIFCPLISGGSLVLMKNMEDRDPYAITNEILKNKVSILVFVPTAYLCFMEYIKQMHMEYLVKQLRWITLCGETMYKKHQDIFFEILNNGDKKGICRLANMYGPTETTIVNTIYECTNEYEIPPIGTPLDQNRLYVLDYMLRPCPPGVEGQIYLGGIALANGYMNKPLITHTSFIPNPYIIGERLYASGDYGKWLYDEKNDKYLLHFIGRHDNQNKINGYRIELGEIENMALTCPGIQNAVACIHVNKFDEKTIDLFYTQNNGTHQLDIRRYLQNKLPGYMMPTRLVMMEQIPTLSNGKYDRKILCNWNPIDQTDEKTTPKFDSDIVQTVHSAWQKILAKEDIDFTENFFDAGGNSLSILRLHKELCSIFDLQISVLDLFEFTTVQMQAELISRNKIVTKKIPAKKIYIEKKSKDIAVIGISVKFPKADDIYEFWENLITKKECLTFLSDEELLQEGVNPELLKDPHYVKAGMFLDNIEYFDPSFFSISPKEAELMDPQHRFFLECCWHALEDGGSASMHVRRSNRIGVYGGSSMNTYFINQILCNRDAVDLWGDLTLMLNNDKDFIATRVNYLLDLTGPGVTIQTGCSTSLAAVHYACQGIHNNECDMALAGGVSIRVPQKQGYLYKEGSILSEDGHCRAFDQKANGTVAGNGCGVVLLKRLDDAIRDKNHIYAVIKGSAINNDGSNKVGFFAPSIKGQEKVIKTAIENAGVNSNNISYIETHGTGTILGDPIELEALKNAYEGENTCLIGSVKTNIGHLDTAAGIAGFIKTALALKKQVIPASLNFNQANEKFDFKKNRFCVNTNTVSWPQVKNKIAGVSSFGMGGTNVHIIMEEPPIINNKRSIDSSEVFLFSAKTEESLYKNIEKIKSFIDKKDDDFNNIAFTLATGRQVFSYRIAFICKNMSELKISMNQYLKEKQASISNNKSVCYNIATPSNELIYETHIYESEPLYKKIAEYFIDRIISLTKIDLRKSNEDLNLHYIVSTAAMIKYLVELGLKLEMFTASGKLFQSYIDGGSFDNLIQNYQLLCHKDNLNLYDMDYIYIKFNDNGKKISNEDNYNYLKTMLAILWEQGYEINWHKYYEGKEFYLVSLPGYQFLHKRYWLDTSMQKKTLNFHFITENEKISYRDVIKDIWEQMLGEKNLLWKSNFFEEGGDSLIASQIISHIYDLFHINITMEDFFNNFTVNDFCDFIGRNFNEDELNKIAQSCDI